uniref:ATP synthase subunit 9 n=1 Tax=Marssonina brunnea f. sp. multigermtubi (strain MB_m1) TaxID=1072389 RepID=G3KEX8_MARBU|nr:ATP synthase subunit 9 [Drepanopeziza brunnea f. sp. 'multigermtubi']AEM76968.1 ATP synthase subunit 9 [Drepanopeziza brunnea f. sp. 'multigermtubi']
MIQAAKINGTGLIGAGVDLPAEYRNAVNRVITTYHDMVTASEGYRGSVNGSEVEAVFIESWDKANVENGVAINPSLRGQLFSYAILGFFAEATGLFALMMAFLLLYVA